MGDTLVQKKRPQLGPRKEGAARCLPNCVARTCAVSCELSRHVQEPPAPQGPKSQKSLKSLSLRIGNGVGKQGYGNRPPIDDRNPIRKFSIDPLCPQNQWDSTDSPRQRIKEKSRYGNSVSTPHRRYGHRLRTPFLRTPFPRLLKTGLWGVCRKVRENTQKIV